MNPTATSSPSPADYSSDSSPSAEPTSPEVAHGRFTSGFASSLADGSLGESPWRRTGELLAWTGLVALGARRGGLLGLAAMGYGLNRLSRLALGTSLSELVLSAVRAPQPELHFGDGTRDLVDEASWESFPASDPPGRGVG